MNLALSVVQWTVGRLASGRPRIGIGGPGIALALVAVDWLAILVTAVVTGAGYHAIFHGASGDLESYVAVGALAALVFTVPFLVRDEYRAMALLEGGRSTGRILAAWSYAILCLALIGFLTKSTAEFSRGWLLIAYVVTPLVLLAAQALAATAIRHGLETRQLAPPRMFVVGGSADVSAFAGRLGADAVPARIAGSAALDIPAEGDAQAEAAFAAALDAAVSRARRLRVDRVVVTAEWSSDERIAEIVRAFEVLPVAVHLAAPRLVGRFSDVRLGRVGEACLLAVTEPPLAPLQLAAKRAFDIAAASIALVLLSPALLAVAIAIKRDSKGPVFFRQRRRGYNQVEFRIWKFRTMTTLDDGPVVVQAQKNDPRVTRVGRILRKYNIDELPQLINVLRGEMSIVGPRPHAVAHDLQFERRVSRYPRRLVVRPGITGWAQIHGFRGATDTDEAMRQRVEHDLHYIDNWSLVLDVYICVMTVLSAKAYKNAV